jgi:hypothetical protein
MKKKILLFIIYCLCSASSLAQAQNLKPSPMPLNLADIYIPMGALPLGLAGLVLSIKCSVSIAKNGERDWGIKGIVGGGIVVLLSGLLVWASIASNASAISAIGPSVTGVSLGSLALILGIVNLRQTNSHVSHPTKLTKTFGLRINPNMWNSLDKGRERLSLLCNAGSKTCFRIKGDSL